MRKNKKFAILVSGRGSNMDSLLQCANENNLQVTAVVSDNEDAPALEKARAAGFKAVYLNPGDKYKTRLTEEAELEYRDFLLGLETDYILLAGFMRMIKTPLLDAFPRRIINIHPSLLPKYSGLQVHERVCANKEKESGCTVHFVDVGMDSGDIIGQATVSLNDDETVESIATKVLIAEHQLYPEIMLKLAKGEVVDY